MLIPLVCNIEIKYNKYKLLRNKGNEEDNYYNFFGWMG